MTRYKKVQFLVRTFLGPEAHEAIMVFRRVGIHVGSVFYTIFMVVHLKSHKVTLSRAVSAGTQLVTHNFLGGLRSLIPGAKPQ